LKNLEKNEVDFSLVSILPETIQFEKVELMPNTLFLVTNREHEIKKEIQDKKIIEKLSIIYREQGSGTRYIMEKFIEKNQLRIPKKLVLTGNEAVKQAVLAGLGCSIMPLIGIKKELNSGDLQIIPIKGLPIESNWNLIWLKGKKFSPVALAYLEFIKTEKNRIIEQSFNWVNS
jgi:LysR family transcriptional regulator, low CO2-responsive transcriptional regulator